MFFSEAILSKNGPLGKVWLAAHWERKLSKNQLLQTNINSSVDAIVGVDQAPMALRLSGQLLLGVTRIYYRKARYLLEDCNEAMVKLKVAVRTDAADNNLLMLDGASGLTGLPGNQTRAAFNAVTVPDTMTEFDLLLPAQNFDIDAWGLNPKLSNLSRAEDITLEEGNGDHTNDLFSLDHGRRNRGLDIEVGRNHRMGGGGYNTMDFDLAGPDDALDLDLFGDDLGGADYDFMKRPRPQVDDLEIEVGRDAVVQRRSLSADPFAMLNDKPLRLGSEDGGRAPSVGSAHDDHAPAFEPAEIRDRARSPLDFELGDEAEQGQEPQQQPQQPREAVIKKRKLVVDDITEMSQEELKRLNADLVAEGLLITHDMLPRSRKLLRLQQIEQDVAHGGLAGYLLDFTAGPRITGSAMVPELASMFSRRLQIDQPIPEMPAEAEAEETRDDHTGGLWQDDQLENWADQIQGVEEDIRHPSPNLFDDMRLDSPPRNLEQEVEQVVQERIGAKSSLFQESDDTDAGASTKELHGTVFSTSAIKTMRLVHQNLELKKTGAEETSSRSTRQSSMATASSMLNKDSTQVTFSELMATTPSIQTSTQAPKRNRADAAKLFFELLVLSTKDVVSVKQEESFGEISVGGSPWLDTLIEADANEAEPSQA
ncbi:sister chromatid cohesion protein 1 [Podila minutissima]|nr:sister chromatid cohesion protein 1 [Podila minutissima]